MNTGDNHNYELPNGGIEEIEGDVHLKYCQKCIISCIGKLEAHKKWKQDELEFLRLSNAKYKTALRDVPNFSAPMVVTPTIDFSKSLKEKKATLACVFELQKKVSDAKSKLSKIKTVMYQLRNQSREYLTNLYETYDSFAAKKSLLLFEYNTLSKSNVWNDLFSVYIDNDIGLINGAPLGIPVTTTTKLTKDCPSYFTDAKIVTLNGAFGTCVLILHCIAKRKSLKLKYYQPMPLGRQSYFTDKNSIRYNLFCSNNTLNDWKVGFNNGMKAFMVCLKEIELHLKVKVPGEIDLKKGTISKHSFEFPSN